MHIITLAFFKKLTVVLNVCLLIYFWLYWIFVAARRVSLVAESRGYPSGDVRASVAVA